MNIIDKQSEKYPFLDFFCGSGLVSLGVSDYFETIWANDNCPKKAIVFQSNFKNNIFQSSSIENIKGTDIPFSYVSWASFPCQDLSLAGRLSGLNGRRSGLFWEWLRIIKEMEIKPPILVLENVTGLLSLQNGEYFKLIYNEIEKLKYNIGAVVLDAKNWLPQSRQRVFIICVDSSINIDKFITPTSNWAHPISLLKAVKNLNGHVWWNIPTPSNKSIAINSLIDFDYPINEKVSKHNLSLISKKHKQLINDRVKSEYDVFLGYKRTRPQGQTLEIRFDGLSGCLRTAKGGSSKQFLIFKKNNNLVCRYLNSREAARLMGVPDAFILPDNQNDGYSAMGDAVAVPVTHYLAKFLLKPLADLYYETINNQFIRKVQG